MNPPVMKTLAAVAWKEDSDLEIIEVDLELPKKGEVLLKIISSGICHTDLYALSGRDPEIVYPCILGHEGAGIVEQVGEGVSEFEIGDHVIPLYTAECRQCKFCTSGKTNLCGAVRATQGRGLMPDGTTRFSYQGKSIFHFMGCSTFARHTVVSHYSLVKINKHENLASLCPLGCGVTTGIGATINTAKVQEGSTVAIFGMGVVGLSVTIGAKMLKAKRIIAIDINNDKKELAMKFGCTEFLNPKDDESKSICERIVEMTDGGVDYSFECVGNVKLMRQALECCHKGWGEATIIGVAAGGEEISTRPFQLVTGRVWRGSAFGGVKGKTEMQKFVKWADEGLIPLHQIITDQFKFEQINEALAKVKSGKTVKCILHL